MSPKSEREVELAAENNDLRRQIETARTSQAGAKDLDARADLLDRKERALALALDRGLDPKAAFTLLGLDDATDEERLDSLAEHTAATEKAAIERTLRTNGRRIEQVKLRLDGPSQQANCRWPWRLSTAKPPRSARPGGDPQTELSKNVDTLRSAVERGRADTISALDGEMADFRAEWEKDRDRHPERELAQIRRAENQIRGMGDDEAGELAIQFSGLEADFDLPQLNELRSRLRIAGKDAELLMLNDGARARRSDSPWLQPEEASKLADYRGSLASLSGGEVAHESEAGSFIVDVSNLVDFSGELDSRE